MINLTLTCPHCGFSKIIDKTSIPPIGTKITCPKCRMNLFYQETEKEESPSATFDLPRTSVPQPSIQELQAFPPHMPPILHTICKICSAESTYEADTTSPDPVRCFNCGNDISLKKKTEKIPSEATASMPLVGIVLVIFCLAPYLVMLFGIAQDRHAIGDKGFQIFLYIFVSIGFCIFNVIAGLPIIFKVKYESTYHHAIVIIAYLLGGLIPTLLLLYKYLHRLWH